MIISAETDKILLQLNTYRKDVLHIIWCIKGVKNVYLKYILKEFSQFSSILLLSEETCFVQCVLSRVSVRV